MNWKALICIAIMFLMAGILFAATGDETITLTSNIDRRNQEPYIKPVWEAVVTSTHDADDTGDVTQALNLNCVLKKIVFKVPNFTNSITGQLVVKDNGNNTIFDSGELAKATTYTFSVEEPLSGSIDIVLGVSGASGGSADSNDMVVTLRGI